MPTGIAISLEDLDRIPAESRGPLLAGRLDLEDVIRHAGQHRSEEVPAARFSCDPLVAAVVCDLIRSWDREAGVEETRVFVMLDTTWTRVPLGRTLTVVVNGRPVLNPDVFPQSSPAAHVAVDAGHTARPLVRSR